MLVYIKETLIMRRLIAGYLFTVLTLFAAWPAFAQMSLMGVDGGYQTKSAGSCAASSVWFARTSGLSATEHNAYDSMICGMISDGVGCSAWSGSSGNLDALYIFATNTTTTANLNLCSINNTLTKTGTVTFSADHGYTGDGSTGYLDTGINPCAGGFNATQNSQEIGAYVLTNRTTSQAYTAIGASDGTNYSYIVPVDAGATYNDLNGHSFLNTTQTSAQGFWMSERSDSVSVHQIKNGSPIGFVGTDSSTCISKTLTILALNGSSVTQFSADQLSAALIGGTLTSGQITAISNRVNAYMTALGINVY
jgi:hypothetical protein